MSLNKETIEKIIELDNIGEHVHGLDGAFWTDRKLTKIVDDPRPEEINIISLQGIVDFINAAKDGFTIEDLTLHVSSSAFVCVFEKVTGPEKIRTRVISAALDESFVTFAFGKWMDKEQFLINVLSQFKETEAKNRLLHLAGKMKDENVMENEDNGITQTVKARKGISLAENRTIENPWILKPYRTFREIEQPESAFIFRVRDSKQGGFPECALFEADGSGWKLTAMETIKTFFEERLPEISIIA